MVLSTVWAARCVALAMFSSAGAEKGALEKFQWGSSALSARVTVGYALEIFGRPCWFKVLHWRREERKRLF